MTLPLLEGLDGVAKMSKSLGNAIGLAEPADQAYGKLMSISDDLMWRYYEVLLHTSKQEVTQLQEAVAKGEVHPMELKKKMAHAIIARFWSAEEASEAQQLFEELFQKKDYTHAQNVQCPEFFGKEVKIIDILRHLEAVPSSSEARRLIEAGAVSINTQKVTDPKSLVLVEPEMLIKVGKHRFYKLV